jgi:1-acyl-sn-glycerol-3-phosphate acyltransferase
VRILRPLINAVRVVAAVVWTGGCIMVALIATTIRRRRELGLTLARRVWSPVLLRIAGARLEVEGRERLDPSRAYFFAGNHQSWLDGPALFMALPMPVLFLAKQELAKVPFVGDYLERMGMVFVDRAHRGKSARAVGQTAGLLREGWSIVAFPEGTLTRDGSVLPFKTPTFAAAVDAGVPVVPLALDGTGRVLPGGAFWLHPGPIRVSIGEPISTAGLTRDDRGELARRVQREVEGMMHFPTEPEEREGGSPPM